MDVSSHELNVSFVCESGAESFPMISKTTWYVDAVTNFVYKNWYLGVSLVYPLYLEQAIGVW